MPEETFFQKHKVGIFAIWRRDSRDWWLAHYVETHRTAPTDGWWLVNPRTAAGGQVAPELMREFGEFDPIVTRRYFREMEARYRSETGLPARGDGWVSETYLARLVSEELPGVDVIREARLDWLNGQRLDIYIPSMGLAIEYQGIQHYEPIDLFGGDAGLQHRRIMDARKKAACERQGIRLIEWRYAVPITPDAVARELASAG